MQKAAVRRIKFVRWHDQWCKKRTSAQQRKSVESWFTHGDGSAGEVEVLKGVEITHPEAPLQKIRKFVSAKEPEFYAFPVERKGTKPQN